MDLVTQWSTVRNPHSVNFVNFATSPTISLQQWTSAYHWNLAKKKVLQEPHEGYTIFYVTSSTVASEISVELLTEFQLLKHKQKTFDDFKTNTYSIWSIMMKFTDLKSSTCSCPCFLKQNTCKHSLGMQIRLKLVDVPPAVKSVPLGQKRKRGRPSKVKKALIVQE